jgi:hypothetical protein
VLYVGFFPLTYLGLAEKVVCEGREKGTGNREQGTVLTV